ncbi:MAG: hypothetical protein ABJE95_20365 [Byssovorax sp.]
MGKKTFALCILGALGTSIPGRAAPESDESCPLGAEENEGKSKDSFRER